MYALGYLVGLALCLFVAALIAGLLWLAYCAVRAVLVLTTVACVNAVQALTERSK